MAENEMIPLDDRLKLRATFDDPVHALTTIFNLSARHGGCSFLHHQNLLTLTSIGV
jgi:hypothetical protein